MELELNNIWALMYRPEIIEKSQVNCLYAYVMQIVGMPNEIPTPYGKYWGPVANGYLVKIKKNILCKYLYI